jgi:hypothetical protein
MSELRLRLDTFENGESALICDTKDVAISVHVENSETGVGHYAKTSEIYLPPPTDKDELDKLNAMIHYKKANASPGGRLIFSDRVKGDV